MDSRVVWSRRIAKTLLPASAKKRFTAGMNETDAESRSSAIMTTKFGGVRAAAGDARWLKRNQRAQAEQESQDRQDR